MPSAPSPVSFVILLGLSFFFGLAFEEFYAKSSERRPGGIRTFPLLAMGGGVLYLLDPKHLLPFVAGLVVLGLWLNAFYRQRLKPDAPEGGANVGLMVLLCNVHAYVLGAVTLALPYWVAVGITVAAVLLFTAREPLHAFAREVQMPEIVTAGQFLILTGIVLPLLPSEPVTTLTSITPRQAWLALLAVCTVSYASYLVQRWLAPREGDFWMALLGGAYSSTATTVVLARRARAEPASAARSQAGITAATAVMYLRILAIVAVFHLSLAQALAPSLVVLSAVGFVWAGVQYRRALSSAEAPGTYRPRNPLEIGAAALFAVLYVVFSLISTWVAAEYGRAGIYVLAAIVGVTDIDPFVLNLAQGSTAGITIAGVAGAILIATASNNLLKAAYTLSFAGRPHSLPTVAALATMAVLGVVLGLYAGAP
ncbi:MAG TPA: DUF4010 domain-containing protein [Stellaceae bacterium]|nr:DUF4010 domain-containing protein [Stellaceae bacterium]